MKYIKNCDDEISIPDSLFTHKGPDIPSPSSFFQYFALIFIILSDCTQNERERANCQLLGKVSSPRFSVEWGVIVSVAVSATKGLCVLKLP